MDNDFTVAQFVFGFIFAMIIGFFIGAIVASSMSYHSWRREAIDMGFAHYVKTDEYGGTEWSWKSVYEVLDTK